MELNLEDPTTAVLVGVAALIVLALVLRLFGLAVKAVVTVVLLVGVVFGVLYATDSLPGG
jgi:predicted RND superfamily exporter protein